MTENMTAIVLFKLALAAGAGDYPHDAVARLRFEIEQRATAIGLTCIDVELRQDGNDLLAECIFDMQDDEGRPWAQALSVSLDDGGLR
ncbi:hypothetical protein [Xenophilus sp. Marseille-Q4582]|uniref:hypothetical protein n=1 Tax=Xenophilus sp. Marseille-Q4582 TaxID=2866600 RepID=UPI001CE422BB|nr:hypothetical protein [Xenophilus sp. Marseille-Q4582]